MNIQSIISIDNINVNLEASSKKEAFIKMAEMLYKNNVIDSVDEYVKALIKRENEFSTGIGFGIAIPHAKCRAVKKIAVGIAKLTNEIDYESMDDERITTIFMIAVPAEGADEHIKILSTLSRKFIHADFREELKMANTPDELIKIFN